MKFDTKQRPIGSDGVRLNHYRHHVARRYSRQVQTASWGLRAWARRRTFSGFVRAAECLKRLMDIVISLTMLVVLLPPMLIVAALIKLTDGGPVLFWQTRVGRYSREFQFPKFRSMRVNTESMKDLLLQMNQHKEGVTFKLRRDPRVTWIGRIIRRLSIDELPQLWSVLKGDMSLVGPRPPLPREVLLYTLADRRRLDVTPGLTCIWQVSGRGDIGFTQQVQLDVEYIESRSLWTDVKLLFKTIGAVLGGRGAY